jgi:short subunit dehydrogenase-like uncharacterized protein
MAAMSTTSSWMVYGAAGFTGAAIACHAHELGLRPVLAGRTASTLAALGERLDSPSRVVALDDPAALRAALSDVDLVVNAAGPFLHTAAPLAEACLDAGVHYLDISNELQVFRSLYKMHPRAQQADVTIIPGVGFGVVATNCLARHVSDAVGGAAHLDVAARAVTTQPGPGAAATMHENLPFGGWVRREGHLHAHTLGTGIITIALPDGPYDVMPVPTGDLEAAFRATGAPDIVAYTAFADAETAPRTHSSFGWARATGPDGTSTEAWLETGDAYTFTAAAAIRAVEEVLAGTPHGALSPAEAFGVDFPLTIPDTWRTDALPADTRSIEQL